MTTELIDALNRWRGGEVRAQFDLEEKLQPLLQEMLTRVRRSRDTPLQFGIDSAGIVNAALKDFLTGVPDGELGHLQDWKTVKTVFDMLIKRALRDEGKHHEAENRSPHTEQPCLGGNDGNNATREVGELLNNKTRHPLAGWLEPFYTVMRGVHPTAIEIVGLRVEGYKNREIAERLGLGLRLVKRIVRDMRVNWERATEKE